MMSNAVFGFVHDQANVNISSAFSVPVCVQVALRKWCVQVALRKSFVQVLCARCSGYRSWLRASSKNGRVTQWAPPGCSGQKGS